MEELGAGFYLAMHDLEIRGAGEVLGETQSGEMRKWASSSTPTCWRTAVTALKQGREPDLTAPLGVTTEINLHAPAILPADYCGDVHERLCCTSASPAPNRMRTSRHCARSWWIALAACRNPRSRWWPVTACA